MVAMLEDFQRNMGASPCHPCFGHDGRCQSAWACAQEWGPARDDMQSAEGAAAQHALSSIGQDGSSDLLREGSREGKGRLCRGT